MNREFIHPLLANVPGSTQVALARAAEESSELTKEAMKALRFGLENRYPTDGPTNAEKIVAEFRDIEQALIDAGLIQHSAEQISGDLAREVYRNRKDWDALFMSISDDDVWEFAKVVYQIPDLTYLHPERRADLQRALEAFVTRRSAEHGAEITSSQLSNSRGGT